ncbi:hypothetical protein ALC56_15339 [Trachymyrmex septentrionalis]|uniref:DDE-1 domain-containing protein n=1 Tax=Trachymyrmex septentrionalis TaxID=34720 RepID=A0A151JSM2_9HYME|nr:hypothetical protein ALC56_15339 [Trachymyrmex septentrionalis]
MTANENPKWSFKYLQKRNTDQTDCEYRINVLRTYMHTGKKKVELYKSDLNKITHSYTARYSLTKSGILLDKVFVCLQESGDTFEVRVKEEVDELLKLRKNISVCSKSGNICMNIYLQTVLKPYIGNNPFLLIVDSWGGNLHNLKCNLCNTNYCFIKCSWYAVHLCFQCFYINFPQHYGNVRIL